MRGEIIASGITTEEELDAIRVELVEKRKYEQALSEILLYEKLCEKYGHQRTYPRAISLMEDEKDGNI